MNFTFNLCLNYLLSFISVLLSSFVVLYFLSIIFLSKWKNEWITNETLVWFLRFGNILSSWLSGQTCFLVWIFVSLVLKQLKPSRCFLVLSYKQNKFIFKSSISSQCQIIDDKVISIWYTSIIWYRFSAVCSCSSLYIGVFFNNFTLKVSYFVLFLHSNLISFLYNNMTGNIDQMKKVMSSTDYLLVISFNHHLMRIHGYFLCQIHVES